MLPNRFNNNLIVSLTTLAISISAPYLLLKNQNLGVSAGLISGLTGGSTTAILLTKGRKKENNSLNLIDGENELITQDNNNVNNGQFNHHQANNCKFVAVNELNKDCEPNTFNSKTNTQTTANFKTVVEFLEERQINLISSQQPKEVDQVWNRLARYLGRNNNCEELVSLHNLIRKSAAQKIDFTFNLSGKSQEAIGLCTQYCTSLNDAGLLLCYNYNNNHKIIRGRALDRSDVVLFLNGGWLERFVSNTVINRLRQSGKIDYLINPKVRFPNQDMYELDLLISVKNQLLWIECKSGNHWNDYLPKYCLRREVLGVEKNKAILVGLELNEQSAKDKTIMYDITVTGLDNLLTKIQEALAA